MKFECDARLLGQVLAKMVKVVARKVAKAPMVVLQVIASMAGALRLKVASGGVTLTADMPAVVEIPGQVFVPPAALADLIRGMVPLGPAVEFEHDGTTQQMRVVSGPIAQTLGTAAGNDVSADAEAGEPAVIRVPLRGLKLALDRLVPVMAASGDKGAPAEIALDLDADGCVTLVATDTKRMAMVGVMDACTVPVGITPQSWNLRCADVRLLCSILNGDAAIGGEVDLSLGTKTWTASWGGYRLTAPFSEREFPRWRSIRPRSYTNTIEVDGAEFGGMLRLLGKVGDTKLGTVRFRWNGEAHASLVAGNRNAGTETDVSLGLAWRARATAPGSELAISAKLLEPLVKKLEPGPVLFSFTSASLPAMVRPAAEAEQVEFLIMPINL